MAENSAEVSAQVTYKQPSLLLHADCSKLIDDSLNPTKPLQGPAGEQAKAIIIDAAATKAEQLNAAGLTALLNGLPSSDRVSAAKAVREILKARHKEEPSLPTIELSTGNDANGQEVLLDITAKATRGWQNFLSGAPNKTALYHSELTTTSNIDGTKKSVYTSFDATGKLKSKEVATSDGKSSSFTESDGHASYSYDRYKIDGTDVISRSKNGLTYRASSDGLSSCGIETTDSDRSTGSVARHSQVEYSDQRSVFADTYESAQGTDSYQFSLPGGKEMHYKNNGPNGARSLDVKFPSGTNDFVVYGEDGFAIPTAADKYQNAISTHIDYDPATHKPTTEAIKMKDGSTAHWRFNPDINTFEKIAD